MTGISAAFTLARALKRALVIEWHPFQDDDSGVPIVRSEYISLGDLFHYPCFQWDYAKVPQSIRDHDHYTMDIDSDWTEDYEKLFSGGTDAWKEHKVLRVLTFYDFTPALLLNPAFENIAAGFPRNVLMSAKEPSVPTPSTLTMRYLFSPYLQKFTKKIRSEFRRFRNEVRTHCTDSTYYGLHLRLRSTLARVNVSYFPCLAGLSAFTGQTCYFMATDSDNSTNKVLPHLPKASRLLFLKLPRARDTLEGIQTALLEIYVLSYSSMVFGFQYSSYAALAAILKGDLLYSNTCATPQSPAPGNVCLRTHMVRDGVGESFSDVVDNAYDQRHRIGCVVRNAYPKETLDKYDSIKTKNKNDTVEDRSASQSPVRACVVYVLTNPFQLNNFVKVSLPSVAKNLFIPLGQLYPVVVFTLDISEREIESLLHKAYFKMLTIVNIGQPSPPVSLPVPLPVSLSSTQTHNHDQKQKHSQTQMIKDVTKNTTNSHTNQSYSGSILKHPALQDYDYIMLLNSDTSISSPVFLNPFERMLNLGLNYAHSGVENASIDSVISLEPFVKTYVRRNSVRPVNLHEYLLSNGHLQAVRYNTHLEIVRKEFFLHSPYYDFSQAVDTERDKNKESEKNRDRDTENYRNNDIDIYRNNDIDVNREKERGVARHTHAWTEGAIKHVGLAIFANPATIADYSAIVNISHA